MNAFIFYWDFLATGQHSNKNEIFHLVINILTLFHAILVSLALCPLYNGEAYLKPSQTSNMKVIAKTVSKNLQKLLESPDYLYRKKWKKEDYIPMDKGLK